MPDLELLKSSDRQSPGVGSYPDLFIPAPATDPLDRPTERGIVGHFRDVTERQPAELQLQDQAALLDQVQDAIIVRDLSDRVVFWNRSAERIYGWPSAEAVGRDITELLAGGDSPDFVEASLKLATRGEWSGELHQVTRDGREIIVESRWKLMSDPVGQPKAVLITNTDVTEKKRLEQQFLRTQRMESIGRLASGIAHDLNNVLSPILMAIHMLQQKYVDPESQCWLETLRLNAERGGQMVTQVLSFARGGPASRTPIQPRHLVREIVELMRITFPKSVQIKLSLPQDLWCVSGDATHLHQVLMNLCVNANEAMPDGGRLTIEAKNAILDAPAPGLPVVPRPGPYVLITVADTGVGISASIIDKIFAPFFTTKRQGKSTGLGLSTVLGIVKKHEGFVEVSSEVGAGTEFRVYLPALATSRAADSAEPSDELPAGRGELILVADDETAFRQICKETLESSGYRTLVARDGTEAASLFNIHRSEVSAVLLNKNMPVMDGPAVVPILRQIDSGVKIILTSGQVDHNLLTETERLGITHLLPKPYSAGRLLKTLAAVLQASPQESPKAEARGAGSPRSM